MVDNKFIQLFTQFYEKFFLSTSDAVRLLADIQSKYPKDYESIKKFSTDPRAIEILIEKLDGKQQSMLLRILLNAGAFGRKLSMLFDLSPKEKIVLANDMDKFVKSLKKSEATK